MNSKKDVRSQPGAPSGGPGRPAGSGDGRNAARDQQSEPAGDGRNQCARGRHSASGPQPALPRVEGARGVAGAKLRLHTWNPGTSTANPGTHTWNRGGPVLSQLMLGREDGFGRFVVPSQRREADSDFVLCAQTISITKAGIRTTLNARTSILALKKRDVRKIGERRLPLRVPRRSHPARGNAFSNRRPGPLSQSNLIKRHPARAVAAAAAVAASAPPPRRLLLLLLLPLLLLLLLLLLTLRLLPLILLPPPPPLVLVLVLVRSVRRRRRRRRRWWFSCPGHND
jgi:hypothetical protein